MKPVETYYPFQLVSIDIGNIMLSSGVRHSFIIAVNHFKRWIKTGVLRNGPSEKIMDFLLTNIIYLHGCPDRIQNDGQASFVSEEIKSFYQRFEVVQTVTAPIIRRVMGWSRELFKQLKEV